MNPILKIIPPEWTIQEDFKDWICALAKQLYNKKDTGDSENILYIYNSNLAESCLEGYRRRWEHIV